MTDYQLRPASMADAQTLSLTGSATFLESFADTLPGENIVLHCSRFHSARYYANALREGATAFMAALRETGTVVGYAMNSAPDLPVPLAPGDVELKRIYLLSQYQGRGIGKALLDACVEDARQRDARRILLGVYHANAQAIAFYKAMGFETVGRRAFKVGEGTYEDLVMARPI